MLRFKLRCRRSRVTPPSNGSLPRAARGSPAGPQEGRRFRCRGRKHYGHSAPRHLPSQWGRRASGPGEAEAGPAGAHAAWPRGPRHKAGAGSGSCLCLARTVRGRDMAGRAGGRGGHRPVLPPAPAAQPGTAQRQVRKARSGFSSPLHTAEERSGEGGSTFLLQTCSCCGPCTKHCAVRERRCAALQAESPAPAESRVPRAGARAQPCWVGPEKRGGGNGASLKNDEGWMLLFVHLSRGLCFQAAGPQTSGLHRVRMVRGKHGDL